MATPTNLQSQYEGVHGKYEVFHEKDPGTFPLPACRSSERTASLAQRTTSCFDRVIVWLISLFLKILACFCNDRPYSDLAQVEDYNRRPLADLSD